MLFSVSPTYLLIKEADIERVVALDIEEIYLPSNVFPVPGGPWSKIPRGGGMFNSV